MHMRRILVMVEFFLIYRKKSKCNLILRFACGKKFLNKFSHYVYLANVALNNVIILFVIVVVFVIAVLFIEFYLK